ncbi:MAG TPA: MBL fold metallo-hydrolase, partial [Gammaproteobacteria bacterium]|nr:MBL fold metallo-hydrolase [Gammaproteobacteria bacterium]
MFELLRYDHGIYALDSGYIRPQLAAIHFIVENGQAVIIDTASYASLPRVLEALQVLGLTPANVAYVFLTHIHLDHAGG